MNTRGIARILQRGFPLVVDPRRGGLGAVPPEADEKSILIRSNIMMFAYLPIHLPTVSQVAKYICFQTAVWLLPDHEYGLAC